jgi:hypothetical protein
MELSRIAKKLQFDAVFITDHYENLNKDSYSSLVEECSRAKDCFLIPGYERDWEGFHILALNQKQLHTEQDYISWTQAVKKNGGLIILAHPARYNFRVPEKILNHCDGIEVWNSKRYYDGVIGPNPRVMKLVSNRHLLICGQDAHSSNSLQRVGVTIKKKFETASEIIDYLRTGNFKLTNGLINYKPEFKMSRPLLWWFHFFRTPFIKMAVITKAKFRNLLK